MSVKQSVLFATVLFAGSTAVASAAAIPAHEIQTLSSAIAAKTSPSTVAAQWGDLLRRHSASGLAVNDVELALNLALRDAAASGRRDFDLVDEKIVQLLGDLESLRTALRNARAEDVALKDALAATGSGSKLTIAHGDKVAAAAKRRSDAVQRLQEALTAQKGLDAKLQLQVQEAVNRAAQSSLYLSQIAAAFNDQIKSIIAILIG